MNFKLWLFIWSSTFPILVLSIIFFDLTHFWAAVAGMIHGASNILMCFALSWEHPMLKAEREARERTRARERENNVDEKDIYTDNFTGDDV